jgi:hypothetical protein
VLFRSPFESIVFNRVLPQDGIDGRNESRKERST